MMKAIEYMTILCIATYFKGGPFLRECKALGCIGPAADDRQAPGRRMAARVDRRDPFGARDASDEAIRRHVDSIARRHRIDRIAALDDFDVETGRDAARAPARAGNGSHHGQPFSRQAGDAHAGADPRHPGARSSHRCSTIEEVADWVARVPPPWVLEAAIVGRRARHQEGRAIATRSGAPSTPRATIGPDAVPRALRAGRGLPRRLDRLGRKVVFAIAFKVRPPADGGRRIREASSSRAGCRTIPTKARAALAMNRTLQEGLGLRRGVSHTEFIQGLREGQDGLEAGQAGQEGQEGGTGFR